MLYLEEQWKACRETPESQEIAAAAVTNLISWLSWLQSQELFSLTWGDNKVTRPRDGPYVGLPLGVGVIEMRLLPETKSNGTKVADVVISYVCASGLTPGLWIKWLSFLWPNVHSLEVIIQGREGRRWTSQYFWKNHMYIWLHTMRSQGDLFLQAFTNVWGQRIKDKYYSFGTYRCGGCSSCSKQSNGMKKATSDEVYEHGRWH
jgi:hypothetical protein